jgi:hypothetical protein
MGVESITTNQIDSTLGQICLKHVCISGQNFCHVSKLNILNLLVHLNRKLV